MPGGGTVSGMRLALFGEDGIMDLLSSTFFPRNSNFVVLLILYPSLRVKLKIQVMRDLPPGPIGPAGMKALDLEEHRHLSSQSTAKGERLTKFAPQFAIGAFEQRSRTDPLTGQGI